MQCTESHSRHHHYKIKEPENYECTLCEAGWGVQKRCTKNHDTYCTKCKEGTYNAHRNIRPCWICSRCGPGLYVAHKCTDIRDTICDSCYRRPAPGNIDYELKCSNQTNIFLAPEDALATNEQSYIVNKDRTTVNDYQLENILKEDAEAQIIRDNTRHMKIPF